jgi:4-hydroxy-tetrahydrodipicolinate synthase
MPAIGRHVSKLSGYAPALPTPFADDDTIDADAFARLCDLQVAQGATALIVGGTTGEAPNLSCAEHRELIRIALDVARGRVPIVAGAGSNATAHAIDLTKIAEANGAAAVLSVAPYYNRPTQDGLYAHFREIAAATGLPIILYDVPSRTARDIADATVMRLAELPQVIGLKDASGDITRPSRLRPVVGPDFRLLSGDDATALGFLAQGGNGCISVTANAAPGLCRNMFLAWQHGETARAQRLASALEKLTAALFLESNPAPIKYALSLFGLMSSKVRLPLVEAGANVRIEVAEVMARLCEDYSGFMIGNISRPIRARRPIMAG